MASLPTTNQEEREPNDDQYVAQPSAEQIAPSLSLGMGKPNEQKTWAFSELDLPNSCVLFPLSSLVSF